MFEDTKGVIKKPLIEKKTDNTMAKIKRFQNPIEKSHNEAKSLPLTQTHDRSLS
jgi:hypothetical protein